MSKPAFSGFALSTSVLWLLTGALYKLFDGSPNDLPPSVVAQSPLDMFETFRFAIAVELAVVGLVLTVPRVGWIFLAGAFATFLAILAPLALDGAASCGCFGSNLTIAPWVMMAIDGGLLLMLLVSKPWRLSKESGLGFPAYLPFLALAIAAPTLKLDRGAPPEPKPTPTPVVLLTDVTNDPGAETAADTNVTGGANEADPGADSGTVEDPDPPLPEAATEEDVVDAGAEPAPAETDSSGGETATIDPTLPEFWELKWQTWEGKDFFETDLASFADQSQGAVLPNSHVVVYRQTCEVCQEHLEMLWEEAQNNPEQWTEKMLVLVRIIETKDTDENNRCAVLPEPSQKVTLPALRRGYGITTPLAFDVDENNLVQNVQDLRH